MVPQPTSTVGQGDQLAKYLKQKAQGKMMALYNKLKNKCDGIKGDASVDKLGTVYNMVKVSQHITLMAVPGDKYSREKLEKTRDKLMEFREASNFLDKTRVDSGLRRL